MMNDSNLSNNTNSTSISQETEDGEIEDFTVNASGIVCQENEIEKYYSTLKNLGASLRCVCCGEVFSDPVKLHCDHLIDRYCISNKIKNKVFKCFQCQRDTHCGNIDDLITDFDIASQIPPKPESLIDAINKHGNFVDKPKRIKLEKTTNDSEKNEISDEGENEIVNGTKIKREKSQRRRKKTRWSAIEESQIQQQQQQQTSGCVADTQVSITGVLSDIFASHNQSKNITISQFKKYTEISNKADIMNLLTEVVMQNTKTDLINCEKKSNSLSDKDILELIPVQELEDLFELEKIQLIMLYREVLDKGVLLLPSQNKNSNQSLSKQALLPTPKKSNNGSVESTDNISPISSRKRYTSESSKSSNLSYRSSNKSLPDTSDSELITDTQTRPIKKTKHRKLIDNRKSTSDKAKNPNSVNENITNNEISSTPVTTSNENIKPTSISSSTNETLQLYVSNQKSVADEGQKVCDNLRYREDINRLHALYSTMYHASLKMKDFEHKMDSEDYQNSYKTYCDNYTEYQQLYSSLQSVINIDSINSDKPDSISNSYTGSDNVTPVVNGIHTTIPVSHQEQASSTISPACYAPDSTESVPNDPRLAKKHTNSEIKLNVRNNLSNYQQFKKENSTDTKKKFGYLWISNLSKEIRTSDLCRVFGKYGHISKVKLFQYKAQIPPTHFGLVFMPNYNEAENAIRQLQNKILNDKQIQIKMLCPNSDSMNKTN